MLTLLQGNCLEVLKTLDAESVQCVVTSPPYYGLRDYGTSPQIWGGVSTCTHDWHEHIQPAANGIIHDGGMTGETLSSNSGTRKPKKSDFCLLCGAWRGQFGLEPSPEMFVAHLVEIFREVRRVLKKDGTAWVVIGDSYWGGKGQSGQAWSTEHQDRDTLQKPYHQIAGMKETRPTDGKHPVIKPKDLIGIPWMFAFAMRADGWYLRRDNIWYKPNPMPESVKDRTTTSHEYIFHFSKGKKYFYDYKAIVEPAAYDGRKDEQFKGSIKSYDGVMPNGQPQSFAQNGHARWNKDESGNRIRNKRSVWTVTTKPYKEAHFATYPPELIVPCILAGSREGDTVLDCFNGSGTTGAVSIKHGRNYIGIELNPSYIELTRKRISKVQMELKCQETLTTQ